MYGCSGYSWPPGSHGEGNRRTGGALNSSNLRPQTTTTSKKSTVPAREITEGLQLSSPRIATLTIPATTNGLNADITDVQYIGSYNWMDGAQCTIVVPGSPPEWTNRPTPYVVREDIEERYIDQNGYKIPTAPLLPLIASVNFHHASPGIRKPFDWSSVDIVTDRNGLRKIFRWIRGEVDADFRIDLQLAGRKTVLFNRWEKRAKDYPPFSGSFGHNFEDATTVPARDCSGTIGHHRVLQYNFGSLKMVVRCEVDACLPAPSSQSATRTSGWNAAPRAQMVLNGPGETPLIIHEGGNVIPQDYIAELKTISLKGLRAGRLRSDDIILQMFISQTSHLFMGVHNRGNFLQVQQSIVELNDRAAHLKTSLLKLRGVLEDVKNLVVAYGETGRLSLICRGGRLDVVQRSGQESYLPSNVLRMFH
ncbi:hypothetical protein PM082_018071 [Marasmius tenuissimus]|nr:hypothetical protein PM082_018071 [Marasmius tenuissimus]